MKIQNYRNSTLFDSYELAIKYIQTVLVEDKSILDGQEIYARYRNNDGNVVTIVAAAYKDKDGNLSFSILNDGLSIISSQDEPSEEFRDNYIWLQETEDSVVMEEDDVAIDIRSMQRAIMELMSIVQRHEYAFKNVMDCGTISNNLREEMMDEATPEAPEGYEDGTQPYLLYAFDGTNTISSITDYYLTTDKSTNVTIDGEEWDDIFPSLDEEKKYLWNYRSLLLSDASYVKSQPQLVTTYVSTRVLSGLTSYYAIGENENDIPLKTSGVYKKEMPTLTIEKPYLFNYLECAYVVDDSENKPNYPQSETPNVKHLVIKSANSEQEIKDNILNLLDNELVWCEGNNGLYIRSNGRIVKINGGTISDGITDDENINEIMSGITSSSGCISTIEFITTKGNKYTMKVDDEKGLMVYDSKHNEPCSEPSGDAGVKDKDNKVTALNEEWNKLYINAVYCGGELDDNGQEINEHSLNPCSHNFVELSNLTNYDINLNGMSLQYYGTSGAFWKVLPLWGIIKAKSTFLIRGAQCSIMDVNTTVIKVDDYDMIWIDSETNQPIKFNNKQAKFYLTYGIERCSATQPYYYSETDDKVSVQYGYIDLVGFRNSSSSIDAYEKTSYSFLSSNHLLRKYYSMDNVSQATKALNKRNNANDWYYIDLTRNDIIPNVEVYTPRASKYNKNIFYDKTSLKEKKPTIVSISFGIQATDNGSGATRCFNWVSKGCYDEFLWYRKKGNGTSWTMVESYSGKEQELISNNEGKHGYHSTLIGKYYYRLVQEATNGQVFTAHKVIIRRLESGIYEYCCGKNDGTDTPNFDYCSDIKEFTVRTDSDVNGNGFTFVHVSDQQGFNWDEYEVWKYSAEYINNFNKIADSRASGYTEPINAQFTINTGDMTQNGNRLNEWFDYFNGRNSLSHLEEMATIGNNDLSPKVLYEIGNGGDTSKINSANIKFFYTFEIDETTDDDGKAIYAPIFSVNEKINEKIETIEIGYIPSIYSFNYGNTHFMCVNSEISELTEKNIYGIQTVGLIYEKIKEWCENDIEKWKDKRWKIAYCHEMPFTIITDELMNKYYSGTSSTNGVENTSIERGGSRINTVNIPSNYYWFSKFCQDKKIRLVMGGHKHTQAITYPIKENENDSMKPIIQVTSEDLTNYFGSQSLIEINDSSALSGCSYPSSWFNKTNDNSATINDINDTYGRAAHFCTFELVTGITAPIYSMSQATGYKHTSNKELPAKNIPWQHYYYPNINGSVNTDQRSPFFTIVKVTQNDIKLYVRRVENVLVGGKFNVNTQGIGIKNGSSIVTTINGLSTDNKINNNHITIKYYD